MSGIVQLSIMVCLRLPLIGCLLHASITTASADTPNIRTCSKPPTPECDIKSAGMGALNVINFSQVKLPTKNEPTSHASIIIRFDEDMSIGANTLLIIERALDRVSRREYESTFFRTVIDGSQHTAASMKLINDISIVVEQAILAQGKGDQREFNQVSGKYESSYAADCLITTFGSEAVGPCPENLKEQ